MNYLIILVLLSVGASYGADTDQHLLKKYKAAAPEGHSFHWGGRTQNKISFALYYPGDKRDFCRNPDFELIKIKMGRKKMKEVSILSVNEGLVLQEGARGIIMTIKLRVNKKSMYLCFAGNNRTRPTLATYDARSWEFLHPSAENNHIEKKAWVLDFIVNNALKKEPVKEFSVVTWNEDLLLNDTGWKY